MLYESPTDNNRAMEKKPCPGQVLDSLTPVIIMPMLDPRAMFFVQQATARWTAFQGVSTPAGYRARKGAESASAAAQVPKKYAAARAFPPGAPDPASWSTSAAKVE
mmetsp:Transcript_39208/g.61255  ORF Transcript_39208/g.61255 Transcript_39208/m.61255 type:complete len:106 (-) Transcript_39208:3-320(-)